MVHLFLANKWENQRFQEDGVSGMSTVAEKGIQGGTTPTNQKNDGGDPNAHGKAHS